MLNSDDLINKVKGYNKFLNPEKLNKAYESLIIKLGSNTNPPGMPPNVSFDLLWEKKFYRRRPQLK